jgi:hypothetical protein
MFCLFQNGKDDRDASLALLIVVPGPVLGQFAGSRILERGSE